MILRMLHVYVSENLTRRDWIEVNGQALAGFTTQQDTYIIRLKEGAQVPEVRAFTTDKNIETGVTKAEAVPDTATAVIGDAIYTIKFQTVTPMSLKSNDFVNEEVGDF